METLLGLVIMYTWVHGTVIVAKKIENTSTYENTVMIMGIVGFALYFIGTI